MSDETQLIEFTTAGCKTMADDTLRLQIDVDPRFADKAFELFGKRGIHGATVRLNVDPTTGRAREPKPEKPQHGQFWHDLIAGGFFRAPPVLRAIGPESEFEDWIRRQRSVLDGNADWDEEAGEHRNECCHVRRVAEGSGTAEKPPYFAVPMTHEQHQYQHQHGEAAVVGRFLPGAFRDCEEKAAKISAVWFEKQADKNRTDWASQTLARKLVVNCQSRSEVPSGYVREWASDNDLYQYLPRKCRAEP